MNPLDLLPLVEQLRESGTVVISDNGVLSYRGKKPTAEQMALMKPVKDQLVRLFELEEAAEQFAKLYDKGQVREAIDVMYMAQYPCYEDGVNDSGPMGWQRTKLRSRL